MSKFSLDVLQQRVFPYTKTQDPDVLLGAAASPFHPSSRASHRRFSSIRCG